MTSPNDTIAKKPGRKAETPAERLARLERDVETARQAVRDADKRKFAIVGAALVDEADGDPAFKEKLHDILRRRVTGKTALAEIAPLLAG